MRTGFPSLRFFSLTSPALFPFFCRFAPKKQALVKDAASINLAEQSFPAHRRKANAPRILWIKRCPSLSAMNDLLEFLRMTLCPLLLLILLPASLLARDLTDALESYIPSLMEDQNIQGIQVHVFRPGRTYTKSFGLADSETDQKLTDDTVFAVGALRGPLTAYALLGFMKEQGISPDHPLTLPDGSRVTAAQLLMMTAGLQSTHEGLVSPAVEEPLASVRKTLLEETLHTVLPAGEHYIYSPQGYQWLAQTTLDRPESGALVRQRILDTLSMPNSFFYAEREQRKATSVATGYEPRGKTPAPIPLPAVAFEAYLDLLTTASDYGIFLRALIQEANNPNSVAHYMLEEKWKSQLPGGRTAGFYYHKLCGPEGPGFYRILSQYPGFAAGAIFTRDGRGAVVLLNARQQMTLQQILDRILPDLYPECRPFLERMQPGYFPENVSPPMIEELEGYYRPRYMLTGSASTFAFLADTHLSLEDNAIRFSGFFETHPSIHLIPLAPDLFYARGKAGMDGWLLRVVRNRDGEVTGLQSDLMPYDRVNVMFSIGGIVGFSVLGLVLLAIALVWFFVRRRES
ncbi:MAG: beta-lactamase family protein [Leptospiraceae bacterium]|nr:beta-lactamase family protein [Leptospiraceae bacterium]